MVMFKPISIYAYILNNNASFLCNMNHVRDQDLCKAFGINLKILRERKLLSQEALANKADVSLSQISRLERGILNPTLRTIYALAKAMGILPSEL